MSIFRTHSPQLQYKCALLMPFAGPQMPACRILVCAVLVVGLQAAKHYTITLWGVYIEAVVSAILDEIIMSLMWGGGFIIGGVVLFQGHCPDVVG